MTIQTNTTDRKALANAIANELGLEVRYTGAPSFCYTVGDFTIDRQGNIIGDDFEPLRGFLLRNNYSTEDPRETGQDTAEEEHPDTDTEVESMTVTIPVPDITVEQLKNLVFIVYSKQYILGLMSGRRSIRIPETLIDALRENAPITLDDFTSMLDYTDGLEGFDFRDKQFTLSFPFDPEAPEKWAAYGELQKRILEAARKAKRVAPRIQEPAEEAEKYTAHIWLHQLGYAGAEMKAQRNLLLKNLHGYCAFSNGDKMQKHKDKYAAIRHGQRAEQQAAETGLEATGEVESDE